MSDPRTGVIVAGRYRLETRLRQGPVSALYAGTDLETGRRVAARVFDAVPVEDVDVHAGAEPLLKLDSPFLAPFYAAERAPDGAPVLVEGAIAGESLPDRLTRQPLALREVVRVLDGLLKALGYCHAHDVLHRDVRPENIFLTGSGPRLTVQVRGAGYAAIFSSRATPTLGGVAYGNPLFTAPEQWVNRGVDASTDLYAVAALGYLLLTGKSLIEPGLPFEVCRRHFTAERPLPETTAVGEPIPRAIALVLQRAVSAERAARFATAQAMRSALDEAAGSLSSDAPLRFEAVAFEVDDISFNVDVSILEEVPIEAGLSEQVIEDMTSELPSPSSMSLMASIAEAPPEPAATVEMSLPELSPDELAEIEAMPDDTLAD